MEDEKLISCINYIRAIKADNIPYEEFAKALGIQKCTISKKIATKASATVEERRLLKEYFKINDVPSLCRNKIIQLFYYENDKLTSIIRNPDLEECYIGTQVLKNLWRINPDNLKLISMPGDKMEGSPLQQLHIRNRDVLLMDTSLTDITFNGIYAYETLGGTKIQVSHVSVNDDGTVRFYYSNPMYEAQLRTPKKLKELDFNVIGRIIKNVSFLHR